MMKTFFSLSPFPLVLTTVGLLYLTGPSFQSSTWFAPVSDTYPVDAHSVIDPDSSRLYLPDDLEATLWAESPLFHNPTNMDIDARGRVWVTEAVNYRKFNNKAEDRLNHPEGERIMIL